MFGIYIVKLRFSFKTGMKYSSLGQDSHWVLLSPSSWAAGWDLAGKGDPHFQKNVLGVIREHPGREDWKVASFLSVLRGRGCSEGLRRCESELKSSPRILQGLFQPSMDTYPRQGPALHVPALLGRAGLGLFCFSKDQVHFNLNKQELKILQNPSRKLSENSLHLFSVFLPYQPDFFAHLLCCLI